MLTSEHKKTIKLGWEAKTNELVPKFKKGKTVVKKFKIYKIFSKDGQIFYWVRVEIHSMDSDTSPEV